MKSNISITLSIATVLVLLVSLFIFNKAHARRLKRQENIETAKTNFLKQLNNKNASVDSTYAINDTMFFYNKGLYIGKTITVTE